MLFPSYPPPPSPPTLTTPFIPTTTPLTLSCPSFIVTQLGYKHKIYNLQFIYLQPHPPLVLRTFFFFLIFFLIYIYFFYCSDLRSVTIHLQNYGPTSETLKHGHIRCKDFLIESCFRVHSSKISKQVNKCLFQTEWSICI